MFFKKIKKFLNWIATKSHSERLYDGFEKEYSGYKLMQIELNEKL